MVIQEVELKYLFKNKKDYEAFLALFPGEYATEHQINYFFDTPDLDLKKKNIFVRLRKLNNRFILTCKAPPQDLTYRPGALSVLNEWEEEIDPLIFLSRQWPEESQQAQLTRMDFLKRIQEIIPDKKLGVVGSFKNKRIAIPFQISGHQLILELDQTDFVTRTDFELEVELKANCDLDPERVDNSIQTLFKKAHVTTSPSTGKAERFFSLFN